MQTVNVLCIKWGSKYGPDYVNRLHNMVRRHLHRPFRFVCLCDDRAGIDPVDLLEHCVQPIDILEHER